MKHLIRDGWRAIGLGLLALILFFMFTPHQLLGLIAGIFGLAVIFSDLIESFVVRDIDTKR